MNRAINSSSSDKTTKLDETPRIVKETNNGSNNKVNNLSDYKWIRNIRALPSNQKNNDVLKKEYIEVNLNNSRKLIRNIHSFSNSSIGLVSTIEEVNENFIRLNSVKKELEWLDALKEN